MKYLFALPVESVKGQVVIEIDANSPAEAERLVKQDKGKFVYDRIIITKLGDPTYLGPTEAVKSGSA